MDVTAIDRMSLCQDSEMVVLFVIMLCEYHKLNWEHQDGDYVDSCFFFPNYVPELHKNNNKIIH